MYRSVPRSVFHAGKGGNFAVAGPHMAVALLSFFYSAIMELLLLPLQLEAKRRIVNYMDKEDEKV